MRCLEDEMCEIQDSKLDMGTVTDMGYHVDWSEWEMRVGCCGYCVGWRVGWRSGNWQKRWTDLEKEYMSDQREELENRGHTGHNTRGGFGVLSSGLRQSQKLLDILRTRVLFGIYIVRCTQGKVR